MLVGIDHLDETVTKPKRFFGSVRIDPDAAKDELHDIVDEVVQHFSSQVKTDVAEKSVAMNLETQSMVRNLFRKEPIAFLVLEQL